MFGYDAKTLVDAAALIDKVADKVEETFELVVGVVENADVVVEDLLNNVRARAEQLRSQAGYTEAEQPVDDDFVATLTREQKVDAIRARLDHIGIKDSKWHKPEEVAKFSDDFIDLHYNTYGGKR